MEKLNQLFNSFSNIKSSLFLTVVMFIIGMIVPGACGLAIYDINLFKELDIIKLILLSIGISSPTLLASLLMNVETKFIEIKDSQVEVIFLFAGFLSILFSIFIFIPYILLSLIEPSFNIVYIYIFAVIIMVIFAMKESVKYSKNNEKDNSDIDNSNIIGD